MFYQSLELLNFKASQVTIWKKFVNQPVPQLRFKLVACPSEISVHFLIARSSRSPCMDRNPLVLYPLADVLFHVLP